MVLVSIRFVFERVKSTGCGMRETVHELLNSGKRKPRNGCPRSGIQSFTVKNCLIHMSIKSGDALVLDRVEFIQW